MDKKRHVFLCGVGGSGMSALALILQAQGCRVSGSDRAYDDGQTPEKFARLQKTGVTLAPQDGSGINSGIDELIVSSAIEDTIPDVAAAKKHGVAVSKRADVLARCFNGRDGIAIGGTSGKSTVTAMLGHILARCGKDPTVINGAAMMNALDEGAEGLGNVLVGKTDNFVIEADESDGTIALYNPKISVLTNVTLDHKPVEQTLPLFRDFIARAETGAAVNLDNPAAASLAGVNPNTVTFSLQNDGASIVAGNAQFDAAGTTFTLREKGGADIAASLLVPGKHNIENALAAIAAAKLAGVSVKDAVAALKDFKGVKRRLEVLGTEGGVTVIDDFGHNPDKIAASMSALRQAKGRLVIMFQPHGFAPMRLMGKDMAKSFAEGMDKDDILILPDILYKGGTVTRDVSSKDTVDDVTAMGKKALHIPERKDITDYLLNELKPGDRLVIMGARDDSLTDFALSIMKRLKDRTRPHQPKGPEI